MVKRIFELLYPRIVDDKRTITLAMLKQIVRNASIKSRFPVAIGHNASMKYWDDDTPAEGAVTNLRIRDEDKMLLGDVELQPEAEKLYAAGKIVGWSVGIIPSKKLGFSLDHLALLGTVGAAFKDLTATPIKLNAKNQTRNYAEIKRGDAELLLFRSIPATEDENMTPEQIAEMNALKADNERLKLAAVTERETEFVAIETKIKSAAEARGLKEDAKTALFSEVAELKEKFVAGEIKSDLFSAIVNVIEATPLPVEPGESTSDGEPPEQTEKPKENFSAREAVDCVFV